MVYGFIKQSGGEIRVTSEEGRGTTFQIFLPRASVSSEEVGRPMLRPRVNRGSETILVVEDDSLVRSYVTTQLESLGYQILSAANAKEAISISDGGAEFDLLFTDIVMPGQMNGRSLVEEIIKRRPALKVLFTSGYLDSWTNASGQQDLDHPLFVKPYRAQELARMLRQVLDGGN
jgi:CheY-like chemotaxis protein